MIVIFLLFVASVSAQCTEENNCEQIDLPSTKDQICFQQDSSLEGHVLAEHTSLNSFACFLKCVDNCQCLSFNFKSDDGSNAANCQLNEAASYSNPESIKQKAAWTYNEMSRTYLVKPAEQSCSRDTCHNGCCQSSPCENGGTCREVCDVQARRFMCTCPFGFSGHRCHKPLRSCHDILVSGLHENGVYKILSETNGTLNVYCDFDAEQGAAWTLVQSYSLEKGLAATENDIFSDKPLFHDFPVNASFPGDWSSYRLSLADMQYIRAKSTHWRATCDFPTVGIDFRDYVRASFDDFDVMQTGIPACRRVEFINIRGNQCIDCTVFSIISANRTPIVRSSEIKSQSCEFDGKPNGGKQIEKNFGYYAPYLNPAFRCMAAMSSTTQYWFGKM